MSYLKHFCLMAWTISIANACQQDDFSKANSVPFREQAATLALQSKSAEAHQNASMNKETQQVYANLLNLMDQRKLILGHQRSTLSGIGGWGNQAFGDGNYSFTSDIKQISNQHPGVLGVDVWDFAMKNPSWNQERYGQAIRDFYAEGSGGLITFEWHMRGCDTRPVSDAAGNIGIPGYGFMLQGPNDPQRSCLCRIVNEEPWKDGKTWLDWLHEEKLDKFADKMQSEGISEIPLLFRPFHEQSGSWFWWGSDSWDCRSLLGKRHAISGAEAYKALFRQTVSYLRDKRGARNLIYVFSPDKLHDAPWISSYGSSHRELMTVEQLKASFYHAYPGNNFVDVLGLDLYFPETSGRARDSHQYHADLFRKNLRALTAVARENKKVSALTETGNYNLHQELSQANSQFFSKYLGDLLFHDPQIQLAYLLFWENRQRDRSSYYTAFAGHGQFDDFKNFLAHPQLLQYDDIENIYQDLITPEKLGAYPTCESIESDPDGDGWGWENEKSCRVRS